MGIGYGNALFLGSARRAGARFDETVTIGRLGRNLTPRQLARVAARFGISPADATAAAAEEYAEPYLGRFLGARRVSSLDYSRYQGCDIVHDLNTPLDPTHHGRFDALIDGGSIEHVFNFPVAIESYMRLVKVGGRLFVFTVANNHCGHGFYQFSPELFFRILGPDYGFRVDSVVLEVHPYPGADMGGRSRFYRVRDPQAVGERVALIGRRPCMIMVHAIKTGEPARWPGFPIQSDYVTLHRERADGGSGPPPASRGRLRDLAKRAYNALPIDLVNAVNGYRLRRRLSLSNRDYFEPWEP